MTFVVFSNIGVVFMSEQPFTWDYIYFLYGFIF